MISTYDQGIREVDIDGLGTQGGRMYYSLRNESNTMYRKRELDSMYPSCLLSQHHIDMLS